MTFKEWIQAVLDTHWAINYEEFCRRAGFRQDSYAEEKWTQWQVIAASLNAFDSNTLSKIVGHDA